MKFFRVANIEILERDHSLINSLSDSFNFWWKDYCNNHDLNNRQQLTLISYLKNNEQNLKTLSPQILLDFANTEFTIEGLIEFAKKYGPLGLTALDTSKKNYEIINAWFYELAHIKNTLDIIFIQQENNIDRLSLNLKIFNTGLWEYTKIYSHKINKHKNKYAINIYPSELDNCMRFKHPKLDNTTLKQVTKDILFLIFENFYRDRVKPILINEGKFSSENQPTSLIGYIWHQLFLLVENENTLKRCSFCKNVFTTGENSARTDKKFCSSSCTVNGHRTETIFNVCKNKFEKKGYKIKDGNNPKKSFRYWLTNQKNILVAGIEVSQTEISRSSRKWSAKKEEIFKKIDNQNLENPKQPIKEAYLLNAKHEVFKLNKFNSEIIKHFETLKSAEEKIIYATEQDVIQAYLNEGKNIEEIDKEFNLLHQELARKEKELAEKERQKMKKLFGLDIPEFLEKENDDLRISSLDDLDNLDEKKRA